MIILTDVDEVIFDFELGLQDWMSNNGMLPVAGRHYTDICQTDEDGLCELFAHYEMSEEFEHMPLLPNVRRAMTELYIEGYRFVCVSAASEHTAAARARNFERNLGFQAEDVICTGGPKEHILSRYERTLWIDDQPYNMSRYHNNLLMRTPRNKPWWDDHDTVGDWVDIAERLGIMILDE